MANDALKITFSILIIFVSSCSEQNTNQDQLQKPQILWANSTPDRDSILIQWEANTESDIDSYKIYRSQLAGEEDFRLIAEVPNADDQYEDTEISLGEKYYYRVTALNYNSIESEPSDIVYYTLLRKPILLRPIENAVIPPDHIVFEWMPVSGASSYQIHVYKSREDGWWEIWQSSMTYPYQQLKRVFNDDYLALEEPQDDGNYRWNVTCSGGKSAGSQSRWGHFSVQSLGN
ncbi:hypothetical protein GF312_21055 [Candidatus Poribacteria bacterium]|nr:hypothetical protein [Candidatus Poribacteria bacterium]